MPTAYDIIGDIHGHAEPLKALLATLGYKERSGSWHHPERTALFLGDFIDRGPNQLEVLRLIRGMIDNGDARAVAANHEFNAIGYATKDRDGRWLRVHGSRNRDQHAAFLNAVGEGSDLHREYVGWFKTLPLFLDLGPIRLAHACWHPGQIAIIAAELGGSLLTDDRIEDAFTKGTPLFHALEIVLKGIEVPLPAGVSFLDKDRIERKNTRVRWWGGHDTFRSAALVDPETAALLPDLLLPAAYKIPEPDDGAPITFFGHYWMSGTPQILTPKATCLDFSIAADGVLAAYSWDGEATLDPGKLRWVGHQPDLQLADTTIEPGL